MAEHGTVSIGRLGVSERLRTFVKEMAGERDSILRFVAEVARSLPAGARVMDVGAGDAPYRELFAHAEYVTVDWAESVHEDASASDVIASADALPLGDGTFDAALLTQVLEHVPEPTRVLHELFRVLRPGGQVFVTAPLAWELHEAPRDFYRYTRFGLQHLAQHAGFVEIEVTERTDSFTTLGQLMRNVAYTMGRAPDGLDGRREQASAALLRLAPEIERLAPLDVARLLPLGYALVARKPGVD
ncbi:MAG: type 11 methyltransferase [Conexibacter sp.]|nr:type 11 methyltransferase [Conexibacter sp.]